MANHTSGPWRAEYTNGAKLTYVVVSAIQGSNGSTVVIGQCAGPDKEANARLIAAAPDTHAALKTALDHIEHMAAFIGSQKLGYSFESLGEDMPGMRDALSASGDQS